MNDSITTRLRRWTHDVDAVPASDLMDEAAAEIERLRWRVMTLESAAKYADTMQRSRAGQKLSESDSSRAVCPERDNRTSAQNNNDRGSVTPAPSTTTQPRNGAVGEPQCQGFVQKNLTLTREEREAIAIDLAAEFLDGRAVAAALRKLLERLK